MENELLFGDCRTRLPQIATGSVDLVLTDPPYNTGIKPGGRLRHFFDDALPTADYRDLARCVSHELFRVLKADRASYVFMGWKSVGIWLDELAGAGFLCKNVIVWDKVVHGLNYQNYAYTHEFLIFAVKGRFRPRNHLQSNGSYRDVWHVRRAMRQERSDRPHHETVKPFELIRRPIEHASEVGDVVLDPFAGSGTTCVVAKTLGRRYLGIERDPKYFRLSLRRLREVSAPFPVGVGA